MGGMLSAEHRGVSAVKCDQIIMRAALHNRAVLHDKYLITLRNAGDVMRDQYQRIPPAKPVKALHDKDPGGRIERARGFVQYKDRRISQDRAGDRDALTLTKSQAI